MSGISLSAISFPMFYKSLSLLFSFALHPLFWRANGGALSPCTLPDLCTINGGEL